MTTFLLATDSTGTSESLCDYLTGRLADGDRVVAVNSHVGGDQTDAEEVRAGTEALEVVEERLGDRAEVETHQLVRGNEPHEDVIGTADEVDADEIVLGVRKRNPTAKVVFGSVAQKILLNSNRPMAVVPKMTV